MIHYRQFDTFQVFVFIYFDEYGKQLAEILNLVSQTNRLMLS